MEDNRAIKDLIQNKKYKECIQIVKEIVIEYIVNLIKEKDPEYEYTNIIDLIELSEYYIEDERKNIARDLEYFSFEEDSIIVLSRLIDICELYNIKLEG